MCMRMNYTYASDAATASDKLRTGLDVDRFCIWADQTGEIGTKANNHKRCLGMFID